MPEIPSRGNFVCGQASSPDRNRCRVGTPDTTVFCRSKPLWFRHLRLEVLCHPGQVRPPPADWAQEKGYPSSALRATFSRREKDIRLSFSVSTRVISSPYGRGCHEVTGEGEVRARQASCPPALGPIPLLLLVFFQMKPVNNPVVDRRGQDPEHRQKNHPTKNRIERGKQLGAVCRQRVDRPHPA